MKITRNYGRSVKFNFCNTGQLKINSGIDVKRMSIFTEFFAVRNYFQPGRPVLQLRAESSSFGRLLLQSSSQYIMSKSIKTLRNNQH